MFQIIYCDKARNEIQDAMKTNEEAAKILDEKLKSQAIDAVKQQGIVFIDEIDKIARRSRVSVQMYPERGVQREYHS